jgi:hypothetical protein
MAQTGYTPIQLYRTATASAAPTSGNLADGELAINTLDGKLFYKDSSGNVQTIATKGAGTIGGSTTQVQFNSSGALGGSASLTWDGTTLTSANSITSPVLKSATTLSLQTNGTTTALYINASQNVGIGTTSPADKLQISTSAAGNNILRFYQAGVYECWVGQKSGISALIFGSGGGYTNEQMRIDSSGTVLINQTASTGNNAQFQVSSSTTNAAQFTVTTTTYPIVASQNGSGTGLIYFNYNTTNIGTITTNGTTTSYNTTSDYRLKNTVIPLTNGLNIVSALKPVTYKWNADNSDGDGFIAHELQSIVPAAVVGEKDAVDADGKPIYQGVDYSKIVVHLVAAIQELSAKATALESR